MSHSISAIIPVCNHQYMLHDRATRLLDTLSELSLDLELVIVDYGSKDLTPDVAVELAILYPQVQFIDNVVKKDRAGAISEGMRHARGELVFLFNPNTPFSATSLRRLWQLRDDPGLVVAQARAETSNIIRASAFVPAMANSTTSIHMIRRSKLCPSQTIASPAAAAYGLQQQTRRADDPELEAMDAGTPKLVRRLRRMAFGAVE